MALILKFPWRIGNVSVSDKGKRKTLPLDLRVTDRAAAILSTIKKAGELLRRPLWVWKPL